MYDFVNMKDKYRCAVKNILNIDSLENAQVDDISGTHMSGKTNSDEIYFNTRKKTVNFFPRGLENFFSNIRGIAIWYVQLKEVHQSDLKPYPNLEYLDLYDTKIEIIEDGLFNFNPNLEVIVLGISYIFHIGPTVFDHLTKLTTLYLLHNKCINRDAKNDRAGVKNLINIVKDNCISAEFLKLDKEIKYLENDINYDCKLIDFETELNASKFRNFLPLNVKLQELKYKKENRKLITTHDFTDFQTENKESLKMLHSSIYDIKTSQADILSMMDHKFSTCSEQSSTFDDKFNEMDAKMESLSKKIDEVEIRIVEKIENILEENLKKILKSLNY